jgi:hypothetical protein
VNFPSDIDAELENTQKQIDAADRKRQLTTVKTPSDVLPPDSWTDDDLSNARRFIEAFGSDIIFVRERKEFYIWHGTHWILDNTNFTYQLATQFVADLYRPELITSAEKFKHAKRSNNAAGIDAMIKILKHLKTVSIDDLDQKPIISIAKPARSFTDRRSFAAQPRRFHNKDRTLRLQPRRRLLAIFGIPFAEISRGIDQELSTAMF